MEITNLADKTCGKCKTKISNSGSYCKACKAFYDKVRYYRDLDQQKDKSLRYKFGLTLTEYNTMHNSQRGLCAICGNPETRPSHRLAVDHCHKTGRVRGLLCMRCNTALGRLEPFIDRAVSYLLQKQETND